MMKEKVKEKKDLHSDTKETNILIDYNFLILILWNKFTKEIFNFDMKFILKF